MKKWFLLVLWMSVPYLYTNATQAPPVLLEDDDEEELITSQPAQSAATVTTTTAATTAATTAKPSTIMDDDEDDLAPKQVNNNAKAEAEAKARAEQERLAAERAEQERLAREKAEQERLAAEKAEQERIAAQKAEQERIAREREEQERIAREREEQERIAREKAEQERIAAEKAEKERIAAQKAEQERLAAQQAEQERLAAERAEQERLAAQKAEQERLATEARAKAEAEAKAKAEAEAKAKAETEANAKVSSMSKSSMSGSAALSGSAAMMAAPAALAPLPEDDYAPAANKKQKSSRTSGSYSDVAQSWLGHSGKTSLSVISVGYSTYFLVGQPDGVPSTRDAFNRHMLNFQLFEFRVGYVGLQLFGFEMSLNTVYTDPYNSANNRPLLYRGGTNPTDLVEADGKTMWFAYKPAIKGFIPCTKWLAVELFGGIEMDLTNLWSRMNQNWYPDLNVPAQNYFFAIHCGAGLMFTASPIVPMELKAEYRHPLSQLGAHTTNTALVPQGIYLTLQLHLTKPYKRNQ